MRGVSFSAQAIALGFALVAFAPLDARDAAPTLQQRVEAKLKEAGPGTRFGLVVATGEGRELIAIAPTDRFIPASNTKIVTTAAAFATLPALDRSDPAGGTAVHLVGRSRSRPDVLLKGRGDARLSSAVDCVVDCLATLADAVAARVRTVGNIIGDATLYPDERWSPGMSWNNIPTRSGTAISALTLDDNELVLDVRPGAVGQPPVLSQPAYFAIDNRAVTTADGPTDLDFDRLPFATTLRLTGTIAAGAKSEALRLGIDDPAHYAAWTFKRMLEARGVRVKGVPSSRYREPLPTLSIVLTMPGITPLASLSPLPLADDLTRINKDSQNLYAELMLHRIGLVRGSGSLADGQKVVRDMLDRAGVARTAYDFSDGSGMSSYNRVAPRAMVQLLRWIAAQPWGTAWRATLPVGGVDGTLSGRFKATVLEGRVFAKTGTLNATNALSGYLIAKSGRTLVFSAYANDVPEGVSASKTIDAVLVTIANEN